MDQIREALANRTTFPDRDDSGGPTFDVTDPKLDPYQGQFTVRLTVTKDGEPNTKPGVHRKVLTALDDPTLRAGFPKRMGAGGEAPLRYADLDGDNQQELVLPTEDGKVHAYRPDGTELPGWPVQTQTQSSAAGHLGSPALEALDPPLEPPRGAHDRRPDRRRQAGGDHGGRRTHLRVGRQGQAARRLARAPRPVACELRPVGAAEGAQAPQVRLPRDARARPPRRAGGAARHRGARARRAPAGLPARRHAGARASRCA